jgi:hypothetical protein
MMSVVATLAVLALAVCLLELEDHRIPCAKDTGLHRLPSREFAINQARYVAAAIAADLIAWLQIHALDDDLATAEPKRLRFRLLHTAARLTTANAAAGCAYPPSGPGPPNCPPRSIGSRQSPHPADPRPALTPRPEKPRRPRPPPRQTASHHAQAAQTIKSLGQSRPASNRHRGIIEASRRTQWEPWREGGSRISRSTALPTLTTTPAG